MSAPPDFHTVVLVGFMGSGKSTVGRRVAEALGWELVDVDALVEARAGRTIEAIFRESGEAAFRAREAEAVREALAIPERVVVPGGGWAAEPGRLESLSHGVLTVWLRVDARTAVERVTADDARRPLLDVPEPLERARSLLERREPFYRTARLHLEAGRTSPERLSRAIVEHVRTGREPDRP